MPHQQNCHVGIPTSKFPLTILTVSSHIFWMAGRLTIATATATDATVVASLPLIIVGRIKA